MPIAIVILIDLVAVATAIVDIIVITNNFAVIAFPIDLAADSPFNYCHRYVLRFLLFLLLFLVLLLFMLLLGRSTSR